MATEEEGTNPPQMFAMEQFCDCQTCVQLTVSDFLKCTIPYDEKKIRITRRQIVLGRTWKILCDWWWLSLLTSLLPLFIPSISISSKETCSFSMVDTLVLWMMVVLGRSRYRSRERIDDYLHFDGSVTVEESFHCTVVVFDGSAENSDRFVLFLQSTTYSWRCVYGMATVA